MPKSRYFKGKGRTVWNQMVKKYGRKRAGAYFYGTVNKMRKGSKAQRAAQPKKAPGSGRGRRRRAANTPRRRK